MRSGVVEFFLSHESTCEVEREGAQKTLKAIEAPLIVADENEIMGYREGDR